MNKIKTVKKRVLNTALKTQRKYGVPIFSYRLNGLTLSQLNFITESLSNHFYMVSNEINESYVLSIQFNSNNYKRLIKKMRLWKTDDAIKKTVWVSLITEYDSHGVTLPKYILDFIYQMEYVDFSFTVC